MKHRIPTPPAADLIKLLDYDPETGIFRWKVRFPRTRNNWRWNGQFAGHVTGYTTRYGYVVIKLSPYTFLAHRLAWRIMTGEEAPHDIDHCNMIRSDNRWTNLRAATRSDNCGNSPVRKNNRVGLKGVFPTRSGRRFGARIVPRGRYIHLGFFDTPLEAHAAYLKAAQEHFGDYARG